MKKGFTNSSSSRKVSVRDIICCAIPRTNSLLQGRGNGTRAFTLIELLVVVLIIGILAAIALPRYTLSVAKTRVAGLLPLMRPMQQAVQRYYIDNNQYPTVWDDLDISLPCTWKSSIICNVNEVQTSIEEYYLTAKHTLVPQVSLVFFAEKVDCYAYSSDDEKQTEFANKVCQSLTGVSRTGPFTSTQTYTLIKGKVFF